MGFIPLVEMQWLRLSARDASRWAHPARTPAFRQPKSGSAALTGPYWTLVFVAVTDLTPPPSAASAARTATPAR